MLMLRYIKFIQSIKKSPNLAVKFLYQKIHKNVNTVTGRNVAYILQATGFTKMEDINLRVKVKTKINIHKLGGKEQFCGGNKEEFQWGVAQPKLKNRDQYNP